MFVSREEEFGEMCATATLDMKDEAGTLEYSDIASCYRPQCTVNTVNYITKQCGFIHNQWCWCSTPSGDVILNTFQKNMPPNYCSTYAWSN